jgi:hypothetical protein
MTTAGALLARFPAYATTGIGSLPFDDPAEAVAHVWQSYDVPFAPHLPALEGGSARHPGWSRRCGWLPDRERRRPLCWPEVLRAVEAVPPAHGVVKIQVPGPCAMAFGFARRGRGRGIDRLARELGVLLAANAAGCVSELRERGADTLLVIDEPGLDATVGTAIDHRAAWEPLGSVAGAWGLHVCSPPPWALLAGAGVDVLFVDLRSHRLGPDGADAVVELVGRGGRIGLGVLPLASRYRTAAAGAYAAVRAVTSLAEADLDAATIAASAFVTSTCGSGAASPALERRLASSAAEVSAALVERMRRPIGWRSVAADALGSHTAKGAT